MRYLRLYRAFVVNNIARTMEFRAQFFASIIGYAVWTGISLVFIRAVFGNVGAVRGWTQAQMWVLYGTYVVLESFCYGVLGPNMFRFAGLVRDGTLDLTLTRPVDVQFFVSTRYLDLNACLNAFLGLVLMGFGFHSAAHWPGPVGWFLWAWLLGCGLIMAYAVWFLFVTLAIWAVKLDAIAVVFDPVLQIARFPVQLYPHRLLLLLTFGIPIAYMTTYPSQALLGTVAWSAVVSAPVLASVLLGISHRFFSFALRYYGSAST